jgi:UDP-glucose 4-epimerase
MKMINKIRDLISSKKPKKFKKAVVTGGLGFIGSHIVDKLADNDEFDEIIVIDNQSSEVHEEFYFNKSWKVRNFIFDISDFEMIKPLFKDADIVFHCAAESRIQPAINNPTLAARTNVTGTCNVLQAAREAKCDRVIYSSTSSAYGLKNKPPLKESMPNDCLNPYSVSKTNGEELCKMYTDLFGLKTITFRYFNVYGDRQPLKGQYAPVVGLFLKQRYAGKKMTVVGDGLQTRDYTNVADVVNANILAMDCKEGFGEIYNVGTGKSHSIMDIVKLIGGKYTNIPERIGESRHTKANTKKIQKILNWKPTVKLEDYLRTEVGLLK